MSITTATETGHPRCLFPWLCFGFGSPECQNKGCLVRYKREAEGMVEKQKEDISMRYTKSNGGVALWKLGFS